jgi:hypothetical protein
MYKSLAFVQEPAPGEEPWANQVADRPGDWEDISSNHADWFLLDSDGHRIEYPAASAGIDGFWLMDPRNAEWRQYWTNRVMASLEGGAWDGLFVDSVETSFEWIRYYTGVSIPGFETDEAVQAATEDFLRDIRAAFEGRAFLLVGNVGSLERGSPAAYSRYLPLLDGVMEEHFVSWADRQRSEESWRQNLELLAETARAGKIVIAVTPGEAEDDELRAYAIASYLLFAAEGTSFRYVAQPYTELGWFPEYGTGLGSPLNRVQNSSGLFWRPFERGTVLVNPSDSRTIPVALPEGCHSRDGQLASPLVLQPHRGVIVDCSLGLSVR